MQQAKYNCLFLIHIVCKKDENVNYMNLYSPRFGTLAVCLPPRSLKKPRPNEERAFLVPKPPSLVFPLAGDAAPALGLVLDCTRKSSRLMSLKRGRANQK